MKMNLWKKLISGVASIALLGGVLTALPASADDTAAEVTYFRQMRSNDGKKATPTDGESEVYCSGYLIDILTGKRYNANSGNEETTDGAEMKTSAREYALMRIKLNSNKTTGVAVSFKVSATDKKFAAYTYSLSKWTDLEMTKFSSVPITADAADITAAAVEASGYQRWSNGSTEKTEKTPVESATSDSSKVVKFEFSVTADDLARGYMDYLIMNTTSDDDATKITPNTHEVKTNLNLNYNKISLTGDNVYRFNFSGDNPSSDKSTEKIEIPITKIETGLYGALVDGDYNISASVAAKSAAVIDLGGLYPVSKIILKNVNKAMIVGLAGKTGESDNGIIAGDVKAGTNLTGTSITLNQNWLRVNNAGIGNLTNAIEVDYGNETNENKDYDMVTLTGAFGNSRYIVLDSNGSTASCGEIEVYCDVPPTVSGSIGYVGAFTDSGKYTFTGSETAAHKKGDNMATAYKTTFDIPEGASYEAPEIAWTFNFKDNVPDVTVGTTKKYSQVPNTITAGQQATYGLVIKGALLSEGDADIVSALQESTAD